MTTRSAPSRSVPRVVKPMLARRPFDSPDHLYEPQWDGIRALAFVEGGRLRLLSRNSRDITSTFPELADLPSRVNAEAAVLDGELVCLDSSGHPSYTRLQERLRAPGTSLAGSVPVHFIAFDLLYLGGRPVMGEPLVDRKALLRDLLAPNELVQACDFIQGEGEAFFQATCELGLEGIVAKEKSRPIPLWQEEQPLAEGETGKGIRVRHRRLYLWRNWERASGTVRYR